MLSGSETSQRFFGTFVPQNDRKRKDQNDRKRKDQNDRKITLRMTEKEKIRMTEKEKIRMTKKEKTSVFDGGSFRLYLAVAMFVFFAAAAWA